MDKFDLISDIITKVDKLLDARGVEKAVMGVEIIQKLNALAKGLGDEDKAHAAEKKLLEDQLKPKPLEDGETREGGETYEIDLEEMVKHGPDNDAE